jgi:hypothetical protein
MVLVANMLTDADAFICDILHQMVKIGFTNRHVTKLDGLLDRRAFYNRSDFSDLVSGISLEEVRERVRSRRKGLDIGEVLRTAGTRLLSDFLSKNCGNNSEARSIGRGLQFRPEDRACLETTVSIMGREGCLCLIDVLEEAGAKEISKAIMNAELSDAKELMVYDDREEYCRGLTYAMEVIMDKCKIFPRRHLLDIFNELAGRNIRTAILRSSSYMMAQKVYVSEVIVEMLLSDLRLDPDIRNTALLTVAE